MATELKTLVGELNVRNLGIVRTQDTNGKTSPVAMANAAALNAYTARTGGEWRGKGAGRCPVIPAGGVMLGNTWTLDSLAGFKVKGVGGQGAGGVEIRHEGVPDSGPAVGPTSRLIAYNSGVGKLLVVKSIYTLLEGINFQGHWHDNSDSALNSGYPISSLLIDDEGAHASDARCPVGIELQGLQNGMGVGKLCCNTPITFSHFRTAIDCVITPGATPGPPQENHADQICFSSRVEANHCDVFLRLRNLQSVEHYFTHIDQVLCHTAFRVERGGKIVCQKLDMQNGSEIGVHISGTPGVNADQCNRGYVRFGTLNIDGTASPTALAVLVDPPTGASNMVVDIGYLHNESRQVGGAPLIHIDGNFYGTIIIRGGDNLYEGMIKVTGGLTSFFPTVIIRDCRWQLGQDPANVFTGDSTDKVQYLQSGNWEQGGFDPTPVNDNEVFPASEDVLNL